MIKGHMRVLRVLPEFHHQRQIALFDQIVCLADISHRFHEEPDMLNAHAPRRVAIGDVMTGERIELGAKESRLPLPRSRPVPAETHQINEKPLQFRWIFRSHDDNVAETALTAQESSMRPAWHKGARRPFLRVEKLGLKAHGIANAKQFLDAAQLAKRRIADNEVDARGAKFIDRRVEFEPTSRFPADVGQPIYFACRKGEAMAPIVQLEIKRERVHFEFGDLKSHDLGAVAAPLLEFGGLETKVANAIDVHFRLA